MTPGALSAEPFAVDSNAQIIRIGDTVIDKIEYSAWTVTHIGRSHVGDGYTRLALEPLGELARAAWESAGCPAKFLMPDEVVAHRPVTVS
jgi:hypothetical protein